MIARLLKFIGIAILGLLALVLLLVLGGAAAFRYVNVTNGTMTVHGEEREYLLHVPARYDRARPAPLVISLHPAMSWPDAQRAITRWNLLADEHGFIVVYPAGLGGGPKTWFMRGKDTPAQMPDVQFIAQLIDRLKADYAIDPARIYADGLSNGGGMAFALSCTLADRIAAVGAVSAAQSLPFSWCPDKRPVPMIAFHGTLDPVVPYAGGKVWIAPKPFPSVRSWTADWAKRNGCNAASTESTAAPRVKRREYSGCTRDASVVLYTLEGMGHDWPGGKPLPEWIVGPRSEGVDATRLIWDFFRRHPLKAQ